MKIISDINIPFAQEFFSGHGEVLSCSGRDITQEMVADADAVLVRSITKVNQDLLEGSSVRFVGTATIGIDHIDEAYLTSKGIHFASAPGSNAQSVAEYVTAALLHLADKYEIDLAGKKLGVVGVGQVGSLVAQYALSLGMEVILNDPPLQIQTGLSQYRQIEEALEADFVTVHTPLTFEGEFETFHLVDSEFFALMKDGSFFINTARGAVMDTAALKKVLKKNKIAGSVIDVWENEPDIDVELLHLVDIATPHIAGYSFDGKVTGTKMIYDEFCDFFGIEPHVPVLNLPEPQVPEILLGRQDTSLGMVKEAVLAVYDVMADDFRLRGIEDEQKDCRGAYFDSLRTNYQVRREFSNTQIVCSDCDEKGNVVKMLRELGFKTD